MNFLLKFRLRNLHCLPLGELKTNLIHFDKNVWKIIVASNVRIYHSHNGVYGYNPRADIAEQFVVDDALIQRRSEESNLYRLICAYRQFGHLKADLNPLSKPQIEVPELCSSYYGLSSGGSYNPTGLLSGFHEQTSLQEVIHFLEKKYCSHLGFEFMYLSSQEERDWFAVAAEEISDTPLTSEEQVELAADLLRSQVWDNFLATKFQSVKRYGGEGAEASIGYFAHTFLALAQAGVDQVVMGMAHRGRLNLLTGLLQVPPVIMFRKMKGLSEFPADTDTSGDVLSHLVSSTDLDMNGNKLHVTMFPNPSHLEAVNPIVVGKTRARQRTVGEGHYSSDPGAVTGEKVVCLQIHGDAALSGQGVMQEILAMSNAPHYSVGGSIHVAINNQVGFTTPGMRTRSSRYCTDIAKMSSMPVIHVNGDNPEAVVEAARLAVAYQRNFRKDIFVDLICWRRWGHNELDNPRLTNPAMYSVIDARKSVPDCYADKLQKDGLMSDEMVTQIVSDHTKLLTEEFKMADNYVPKGTHFEKQWSGFRQAPHAVEVWDSGIDMSLLKYLGAKSVEIPDNFAVHPNLIKSHIGARIKKLTEGDNIDWATAEALAMASIINEGNNVRISGQDVGRGTFSQRHCMMVDQESEEMFIPLNHINEHQTGHMEVANSILSEEAVLGFEYGYSVESPHTLVIWEAQFGDFFNGAQIMIDTFVSSGETKWLTQSGLVMVLPHGYDGAGPEHSSCHIERFLQNCDSFEDKPDSEAVNWGIAHPTTPAQYFHLLRRQMVRNYRKPLIIAGPKILLRLPAATSSLIDMAPGTSFQPVIGDSDVSPENVSTIVFVSGKHYYTLAAERKVRGIKDTAIIRLEALCPFPAGQINQQLEKYKKVKRFIWSQEEHRNMGAWSFVNPRFENLCATKLNYVGREVLGTPAVGIGKLHQQDAQNLLDKTFTS